jgi:hypothetical protein
LDVRREHGHEEPDQSQRCSPRESRHQETDRAGELRHTGQGHEEAGTWQLRRNQPNEVGPCPREMRDAGEDKHDSQDRPLGCRPIREGGNPESAAARATESRQP